MLALGGCSDGAARSTAARDAGADRGDPYYALPPCAPTTTSVVANIFDVACNGGTCHGSGTPAWDLYLAGPGVLSRVVGARSGSCPGWLIVDPGSPETSLLYRKIASPHPPCGERMPWAHKPLSPSTIECVRGWIVSLGADAG
jgi:hypothetical protein